MVAPTLLHENDIYVMKAWNRVNTQTFIYQEVYHNNVKYNMTGRRGRRPLHHGVFEVPKCIFMSGAQENM